MSLSKAQQGSHHSAGERKIEEVSFGGDGPDLAGSDGLLYGL